MLSWLLEIMVSKTLSIGTLKNSLIFLVQLYLLLWHITLFQEWWGPSSPQLQSSKASYIFKTHLKHRVWSSRIALLFNPTKRYESFSRTQWILLLQHYLRLKSSCFCLLLHQLLHFPKYSSTSSSNNNYEVIKIWT